MNSNKKGMEGMQRAYSSLPSEISESVRKGALLVGDDFNNQQLETWFSQEQEAFYEGDAGNSDEDPWYTYMRYVNETLGFSAIRRSGLSPRSILVLGPGSGKEVERFATDNPQCKLNFLEASVNFRAELREKFPWSEIIDPKITGNIELADLSQDVVCAFSVLHHIPNVSKVVKEVSRVTSPGGFFMVREPCSSMGDWRYPRSATPNERGISRSTLLDIADKAGFDLAINPVPIIFEPINTILKRTIGFSVLPLPVLYRLDRLISKAVSVNDHYWRDNWFKKIGPSSYFYMFRKRLS